MKRVRSFDFDGVKVEIFTHSVQVPTSQGVFPEFPVYVDGVVRPDLDFEGDLDDRERQIKLALKAEIEAARRNAAAKGKQSRR